MSWESILLLILGSWFYLYHLFGMKRECLGVIGCQTQNILYPSLATTSGHCSLNYLIVRQSCFKTYRTKFEELCGNTTMRDSWRHWDSWMIHWEKNTTKSVDDTISCHHRCIVLFQCGYIMDIKRFRWTQSMAKSQNGANKNLSKAETSTYRTIFGGQWCISDAHRNSTW